MMKKVTVPLSVLVTLFTGIIFFGCFEEPTIDPVKVPYSSIRVGNFSFNIDKFNVSIDGISKGTLNRNELTEYFDITSGKRNFELTDEIGNIIFNGDVQVNSYEEMTIVFDGVYAPSVDTLHSFAPYSITDGVVYLEEAPATDEVKILTSNFAPNTDTSNAKKYFIYFEGSSNSTPEGPIEYNNTLTLNIAAGDYTVYVLDNIGEVEDPVYVELSSQTKTMVDGMRYNIFLTGDPKLPEINIDEDVPLPVRPK